MREDHEADEASPLGRQDAPEAARGTGPLSGGPSIAGRRGHGVAGRAREGAGDELTRENADASPSARRGTTATRGGKDAGTARTREEAGR